MIVLKIILNKFMKQQILIIFLMLAIILWLTSSCTPNPYWAIKHHDGIEQRTYMKRAWPIDQTCRTYTGNNPIQHKTWANQFYWKKK